MRAKSPLMRPFWETKSLAEMNRAEWESLCDGCGQCCIVRFEDEDTGIVYPTKVHCKLFDNDLCRCVDYPNRQAQVPDCIRLTPGNISALQWMPKSCGYRRVNEGRGLAWWHPLVSGDHRTVEQAGVSVRGQTISELSLKRPEDAVDHEAPEWMEELGLGPRPSA